MDFSQPQQSSRRLMGFGFVVLLHVLIAYALVTGLARKVVEVVKGPIEVKVIEEIIKKPPPPPEVLPPPPKVAAPPPPFIPPPEINITPPPTLAPTITAVTPEAPPGPQAPVIAKPVESAPAPPAVASAGLYCPNYREVLRETPYPREAQLEGIQGTATVEFSVAADGTIRNPRVVQSSNRIFNRTVTNAVATRLKCQAPGRDIPRVSLEFAFTLS
jgi:periplasmic protein TonB